MNFGLMPPEAYRSMPDGDERKFAYLMNIAQGELSARLTVDPEYNHVSDQYVEELKAEFVALARGLAEEFGIRNLPIPGSGTPAQEYSKLIAPLTATIVRIQARSGYVPGDSSGVQLGYKTKGWLRQEIAVLIGYVEEMQLPDWKRKSLLAKLNQLLQDVDASRFSYANLMAVLVPLAALAGGGTTAAVNAPKITASVHSMIDRVGQAYAEEETEQLRISGPPLAIEDMRDAEGPFE